MTTDANDFSFDGCRAKLRDATRIVLEKESDYEKAIRNAADAEAFYRTRLGDAFKARRDAGDAVEAANIAARSECAVQAQQRDTTAGLMKLAAEKLEDARDSRRSLWRLVEWARERDLRANGGPPNA